MTEQQDLFGTLFQRPEDDPFVREILSRFSGEIVAIQAAKTGPAYWVETVRPPARRRAAPVASGRSGSTRVVRTDFMVNVRNRSQAKKGINIGVYRYEYEDGTPAGLGLFESEAAAKSWRKR